MIVKPGFSPFYQLAWVSQNLERTMEDFERAYGIPEWFVMDAEFGAVVDGKKGMMNLHAGFVFVDDVQYEVIEARPTDIAHFYNQVLPTDGSFATVFHHLCMKIPGPVDAWYAELEKLTPDKRMACYVDSVEGTRFAYTDERHLCGLHIEYFWIGPELETMLGNMTPRYFSDGRPPILPKKGA